MKRWKKQFAQEKDMRNFTDFSMCWDQGPISWNAQNFSSAFQET